jgi:hypothetical protein
MSSSLPNIPVLYWPSILIPVFIRRCVAFSLASCCHSWISMQFPESESIFTFLLVSCSWDGLLFCFFAFLSWSLFWSLAQCLVSLPHWWTSRRCLTCYQSESSLDAVPLPWTLLYFSPSLQGPRSQKCFRSTVEAAMFQSREPRLGLW